MSVKLIECPRDAMQGFHRLISTDQKVEYLNALLKVGFDAIDCGSFVSAKAVPQLADTAEVLKRIDTSASESKLLTIVANERGAEQACSISKVDIIGFPFSISETFQIRNTRQTIFEASERLRNIRRIAEQGNKTLLVYLSMGFGNPYNDDWSPAIAVDYCKRLADEGVQYINLSDTIGRANADDIRRVFSDAIQMLPELEFGAHFHTRPDNYLQNISAAYESGCRKYDAAIKGLGGCPFADDKLTGNLPTELLLDYLNSIGETTNVSQEAFSKAYGLATSVFI